MHQITFTREANENYCRYLRDKEINLARYKKLNQNGYSEIKSQDLKSGDIILVEKTQRVPADCVLLKSEELSGEIFIRTDQLDGETDWKRRNSHPETQHCSIESIMNIEAEVEEPSKNIYSFNGKLLIRNFVVSTLDNQILFNKPSDHSNKSITNIGESTLNNTPVISQEAKELGKIPNTEIDVGKILKTSDIDVNRILDKEPIQSVAHNEVANNSEIEHPAPKRTIDFQEQEDLIGGSSSNTDKVADLIENYTGQSICQKEVPLDLENTM
ncbi:hypothetical protein ACJJTC_016849 [Scirpophaga incertulas]